MPIIKLQGLSGGDRRCEFGFLQEYIDWTQGQESPEDYHIWTALSMVACALGRRVFLNRRFFNLYPNMLVLLIGESAFLRKSTSIRMGVNMLKKSCDDLNIFAQKITPEALIGNLATRFEETHLSEAIIYSSEFASFFGKAKVDPSLIDVITDLYDCPDFWEYETRGRGKETCNNVCLNMIAGSTPEWLKRSLPEEMLSGGFYSRLVPVFRTEGRERDPFPEDRSSPEQRIAYENCLNDLRELNGMVGEFTWTLKAKELYAAWYSDYGDNFETIDFTKGYYGRKQDLIIKLAMLISACMNSKRVIDEQGINFALTLLVDNEKHMRELTSEMGQTQTGVMNEKVLLAIRKMFKSSGHKPVPYSPLLRNFSGRIRQFEMKEILATLENSGQIQRDMAGRGNAYTPVEQS